ncbi:hypothetical protein GC175_32710 [bacterium]|nr:hypothetical protein [bacterium]
MFSLALVATAHTQETAVEPQNGTIAPLLYLPVISSTYQCQGVTEILREECLALVWLYLHTQGRNWTYQDGWLTEVSPCTWYGVLCTDGHVTELVLNGNNLQGSLPPEIGDLVHLQQLDLGSHITSAPPHRSGICRYPSNRQSQDDSVQLNISRETSAPFPCVNRLVGTIPPQIKNLTKLRQLVLGGGAHSVINRNQLTLPSEIGNLSNLQELDLSGIQLTMLPPEIGNLSNLQELNLSTNQLTTLPPEIGNLSNLQELELSTNQLTTLPPEIGNLSSLQWLYLLGNQLTTLPPEIGNLSSLQSLYLWVNRLTALPPEIGNLSSLKQLELWDNQLTMLPPEIGNLSNLQELNLSTNQLTTLPPEIGNLSSLQELELRGNQLTTLPPEIGNLSLLEGLDLEQNQLTTLPIEITQLKPSLGNIDVSHNHLVSLANQQLIAWLNTYDPDWRETQTPP